MPATIDILLSQRFVPEMGGSIRWMYEVYRRWPSPVEVVTHDYYRFPPNTPEMPGVPAPANGVDHVTDPALRMDRRDIFMRDWGLENVGRLRRYARMTRAVRDRLRAHPDALVRVHCTHAVPEVASLLPLRWRRRSRDRLRIICYAHGEEVTACASSRQLQWLMHRANAAADVMIANSAYTQGVLTGHVDPHKVHVVHPGVEVDAFAGAQQAGAHWRQEQNLANQLVVVTVGRLDPRKNQAAVIAAMAALSGQFPDLLYYVAGDGREMANLRALADRLGVGGRVRFLGTVDGALKLALYGGCDVFAMPAVRDGTDVEGFGMVFLEAGACGKPVIAGKEGGQPEAVVDNESGLVVDGTDSEAVTRALGRLLSDRALRARMGEAGRRRARELDWSAVVQRTLGLVENIP